MITQQTYALFSLSAYATSRENTLIPPPPWIEVLPQPTGTDGFAYACVQESGHQ
jgi:hypothetical protein